MCRNPLPFFLLLLVGLPSPSGAQGDLSRYRTKNRLLLIFAPRASDPRWARQDALLARSRSPFADRDLLRFDLFERGQSPGAASGLRARYHIKSGSFRVLLIGKDGHVAFSSSTPVALSDLTSRIDRMPMRQDEMRHRSGAG